MRLNKLYKIQEKHVEEDLQDPQVILDMLEEAWEQAQEEVKDVIDSIKTKKVHYLDSDNYYLCNKAVGNGVRGLATKNIKLVTCKNCLLRIKNWRL